MQPSRAVVNIGQQVENTTADITTTVATVEEQARELTATVNGLYDRTTNRDPAITLISIGVIGGLLIERSIRRRRRNQPIRTNVVEEIASGVLAIASGLGLGFTSGRMSNR